MSSPPTPLQVPRLPAPIPADRRNLPPPLLGWEKSMETVLGRLDEVLRRLGDGAAAKSHYTVREVAQTVGRSEYRVRAWIKQKRVKAIKVDGIGPRSRWLIPAEELQKLLSAAPAAE